MAMQRPCPMFVISVSDVLALDALPTHEDAQARNLVKEYDGTTMGPCAFVSQTWLSFAHPDDAKGSKCALLQSVLRRAVAGDLAITPNANAQIVYGKSLSIPAKQTKRLRDGYVWFDIFSVPQQDHAMQAKAIASIFSYVGEASFFFVLAGAWSHADTGEVRDFRTWEGRGWCRVEQISNALSLNSKPLIVIQSSSDIRTYGPGGHMGREWINRPVGLGAFSVESDREALGPVIEGMIESKMAWGRSVGTEEGLLWQRVLHVVKPKLLVRLGSKGEEAEAEAARSSLEEWLGQLGFTAFDERTKSNWSPLRLAAMSGRVDLVRELCERGAEVNAICKASWPAFVTIPRMNIVAAACFSAGQGSGLSAEIVQVLRAHPCSSVWSCVAMRGHASMPMPCAHAAPMPMWGARPQLYGTPDER